MPKELVVKKSVELLLDGLTDMQRLYAEARLHGLAPLDAASAAGLSQPSIQCHAYEKHPKISPIIRMASSCSMERYQLSRDDVVSGFMDAVNAAGSSTELTQAWREIGKMLGHYAPELHLHNHSVENMTLNKLESMPEQELLELAEMDEFTLERDHILVADYEVLKEDN